MTVYIILLALFAVSFLLSFFGTKLLIPYLKSKAIFDTPNERSNHKIPIPRGGGIAIVGSILICLIAAISHHTEMMLPKLPIFIGFFILALISWIDDRKPLSAKIRLLVQIVIVSICIYTIFVGRDIMGECFIGLYVIGQNYQTILFQGLLPFWLDIIITAFIWIWFINLFNFMDGIDGITSVETLSICIGIVIISLIGLVFYHLDYSVIPIRGWETNYAFYATMIAGATLGFMIFNWSPAKIFMGDVGSIPLGFILGWLLLEMAIYGYWAAAIILPMYYLADSTYTLLKRLFQGKRIMEAHSEHFYQQAVRAGKSHSIVVKTITIGNIVLIGLAILSINYKWLALALATITALILLWVLKPRSNLSPSENT